MSTTPIFGRIDSTVNSDFDAVATYQKNIGGIKKEMTLNEVVRLGLEVYCKEHKIPASVFGNKKKAK